MLAIKVLSSEAFYCLVVTREGDLSAHTADVPINKTKQVVTGRCQFLVFP